MADMRFGLSQSDVMSVAFKIAEKQEETTPSNSVLLDVHGLMALDPGIQNLN